MDHSQWSTQKTAPRFAKRKPLANTLRRLRPENSIPATIMEMSNSYANANCHDEKAKQTVCNL